MARASNQIRIESNTANSAWVIDSRNCNLEFKKVVPKKDWHEVQRLRAGDRVGERGDQRVVRVPGLVKREHEAAIRALAGEVEDERGNVLRVVRLPEISQTARHCARIGPLHVAERVDGPAVENLLHIAPCGLRFIRLAVNQQRPQPGPHHEQVF